LLSAWLWLTPRAARAATLIVGTAVDESAGHCGDGDTITFAGDYTIYLNS
jgi:hypothetical protein